MIIGLLSYPGGGKGTASRVFSEFGFEEKSFAAPLKTMFEKVFDVKLDKSIHRHGLVYLAEYLKGNINWKEFPELYKKQYPDTNVQKMLSRIELYCQSEFTPDAQNWLFKNEFWCINCLTTMQQGKKYTISDMRYQVEADIIKKTGGFLVTIDTPLELCHNNLKARDGGFDPSIFNLKSENEWKEIKPDFTIKNDKTLQLFEADLRKLAIYLTNTTRK